MCCVRTTRLLGRAVGAAVLAALSGTGFCQAGDPSGTVPSLGEVTVKDAPGDAAGPSAAPAQYSGTGLLLRSKSTLGETLSGMPGVSSSYFGPNASRPIIRGLDGERVRILSNGGSMADVSALSYDHAVGVDPIGIEKIELLRGASALLYGGQTSGVVNLIDNRIAREPLFDAAGGVAGKVDLGYATGSRERSGAALIETGTDRYALHVDAFTRKSNDVQVPIALACTRAGAMTLARRICNSANETRGGAIGGTVFSDRGYLGASIATYRSDYGTVAEADVTIGMRQDRYAIEGGWRVAGSAIDSVKLQFSHTDYRHTEFESGAPGTVFRNQANDLRIEARQTPIASGFGKLDGLFGVQSTSAHFSAQGEEAFAPPSRSRRHALFALEELSAAWGTVAASARVESVRVESLQSPDVSRFELASRRYAPASIALGGRWNLATVQPALADWQLTANLAHVERAPSDVELFANGPHLATGAYEMGNSTLAKERSNNLDLGAKWQRGSNRFSLSAFVNRYSSFVAQIATGERRDAQGVATGADGLPVFAYRQVPARFVGFEAGGSVRLIEGVAPLDLELRADRVRATNLATNETLPRIAPWRAGATLAFSDGPWGARLGFDHFARQDRVPAGDAAVGGYTLWNASLDYRMKVGAANLLWFARIDNIGNQLAYSATSILTQSAPGHAPLPGRSLKVGLRASF